MKYKNMKILQYRSIAYDRRSITQTRHYTQYNTAGHDFLLKILFSTILLGFT